MVRRGGLLLWCLGLAFPEGSSCRGLDALARSSRQAPLAGALPPWPGKLLLPGPRSSVLHTLFLNAWSSPGPKRSRGDPWRSPGKPCRMVLHLPVHKFGVLRYPYFSTPTGAPGPGPYTVPSVVGPGPNSARARVAWVALLLNFAPVVPSPGGARLSRRRGGEACEVCVTWVACAGLNRAGMRHVVHNFFSPKKGRNARSLFKWREAWRRGSINERGRGAAFGASVPHNHGMGRGRLTRRLSSARPPRGLHALGVAAAEAGNRADAGRGSGSAPVACPSSASIGGAGRPCPHSAPL